MSPSAARWSNRLLRWALLALAAAFVLGYAVVGARRLVYPFELEWMEGGVVDEVRRVLDGRPLYVRPTLEFVPFIYTPLYFYAGAAASKLLGVGFLPLRLLSYGCSFGVMALVGAIVRRETHRLVPAVAAVGLFAATYPSGTAFLDLARVDSLFLLLLLAAIYALRFDPSPRGRAVAGGLLTLAFLTKQSALLAFAPLALHVVLTDRLRAMPFLASSVGLTSTSVLALDRLHHGWFRYYVFWLPSKHPFVPRMLLDFWTADLFAPFALALAFAAFYLCTAEVAGQRRLYLLAAVGALGISWSGRLHAGGWPNVLLPTFALLAILFGLGLHAALDLAERAPGRLHRGAEGFALLAGLVQLATLVYDPRRLVPTAADEEAGNELLDAVRAVPGEVFLPGHGYLGHLAGKATHAQEMAMSDILGIGGGAPGKALRDEVLGTIEGKRFQAIITDTDWLRGDIERAYRGRSDLFRDPNAFWTVTGMRTRPRALYVPK